MFAHDPETLAYFVESDCKRGRPSLAQMLAEALVVPAVSAQSRAIRRWAARVLEDAPPAPPPSALDGDRYAITDLLNDFRDDTVTIAFQEFFRTGNKESVIRAVLAVLEPFGGELFDGYHRARRRRGGSPPAPRCARTMPHDD